MTRQLKRIMLLVFFVIFFMILVLKARVTVYNCETIRVLGCYTVSGSSENK